VGLQARLQRAEPHEHDGDQHDPPARAQQTGGTRRSQHARERHERDQGAVEHQRSVRAGEDRERRVGGGARGHQRQADSQRAGRQALTERRDRLPRGRLPVHTGPRESYRDCAIVSGDRHDVER